MISGSTLSEMMQVNVYSAIALTKVFRQKGISCHGGSIVLLSSIAGFVGRAALSEYCASKGALAAFVRSAAMELARDGIRINCVAPGLVMTDMASNLQKLLTKEQMQKMEESYPLGGLGQPRDVANAVAFLLAESGRWITGTSLIVDGGYSAQ
jgi:NAD(P)-dependent dehydrogenase (short-subunit alcohol dehydrogenase family)